MRFKCGDCGYEFYDRDMGAVTNSEGETHSGCPLCRSWQMFEVKTCALCGGSTDWEDMEFGLCGECRVLTQKELSEFCDTLCEEQLDYLTEFGRFVYSDD